MKSDIVGRRKSKLGTTVTFFVTLILAASFVTPVYFAMISAFKSNGEILKNPLSIPTSFYIQNFQELFSKTDFVTAILHTIFLTVVSEVLIVCVVPLAAYGISRHRTRATKLVYTYFLSGMMIPFHLYMFPLFRELKMFGLFGNLAGPVVVYISGSVAFGCLLYTSFLNGVPVDVGMGHARGESLALEGRPLAFIQDILRIYPPAMREVNQHKISVIALSQKPAIPHTEAHRRGVAHFFDQMRQRHLAALVQFEHRGQRMLHQRASGGAFEVGTRFFLERVRRMIGGYHVHRPLPDAVEQRLPVGLGFDRRIPLDLIS